VSVAWSSQNCCVPVSSKESLDWCRIALAVLAVGAMWFLSVLCIAVFLVAPMSGFDEGQAGPGRWSPIGLASVGAAVALYLGSGVVAAHVGRTRWLAGTPVAGLAAWGVGVWIASLT
jgi:hypothetical protein